METLKNNRLAAALALLISAGEKRIERQAAAGNTRQDAPAAAADQQAKEQPTSQLGVYHR